MVYVHIVLLKEQPESQRYSVFNYIKRESGKSKAFILLFSEMISHFSSTFVISSVTRIHWSSRGVEECRGEHSATVSVISCVHIITKSCSYMHEHMCPMLVSCSLKENESICFTRWNYLALSDGEEEVSWVSVFAEGASRGWTPTYRALQDKQRHLPPANEIPSRLTGGSINQSLAAGVAAWVLCSLTARPPRHQRFHPAAFYNSELCSSSNLWGQFD